MSWVITYYGVDTALIDVDISKKINQLNVATISCDVDIPIDSEVTLKREGVVAFGGYVKKKKTENGIIFEYDIIETFCELNDQLLYEGIMEYDVIGQTVKNVVSDILVGTGWQITGNNGDIGYLSQSGSDIISVGQGNINLITGAKKLNVGDQIAFNRVPPTPFDLSTIYYVVYADDISIKLSAVDGGNSITATEGIWYLGGGMEKVIKYMSAYWAKKATAINKVVSEIGEMVWWTDATGKKLSFDYSRVNRGSIDDDVIMIEPEEDSFKRGYDKVIVLGKTDSIKGIAGSGTKVVVYKYEDCNNVDEAEALARTILNDLGKVSRRVNVTLAPGGMFNEADVVEFDGVEYMVFDVTETYGEVKLGLGAMKETIMDMLGDKLKEVTGEVGTGVNGTFDGGLQNMGAPSVNMIVSVNTDNNTFAVHDVLLYYSNGDRVEFSSTGNVPSPLVKDTVYYVVQLDSGNDTFKVSATSGGSVISLGTAGSGIIRARNMDSQSIPAEVIINVPDVEKIGNVEYMAQFSQYRDQMSIGDEVEFLSVPLLIETSVSSGNVSLNYNGTKYFPSSNGTDVSPLPEGFQFGIIRVFVQTFRNSPYTASCATTLQLSYNGGSTWENIVTISSFAAEYDMSRADVKEVLAISGEVIQGTTKLRLAVANGTTLDTGYMYVTSYCQPIPRHTHMIDKQNNVLKSTLGKNVKCLISNEEFNNELIYTWNGTVNGDKDLTGLHGYLRNGINILQFYSESPGSVYVTGTFESYSV